jgi:hypothetical protein
MTHTATTRNRRSPRACTAGVEARLVPTPQHSSLCRGLSTLGSRVLRPQHVGVIVSRASSSGRYSRRRIRRQTARARAVGVALPPRAWQQIDAAQDPWFLPRGARTRGAMPANVSVMRSVPAATTAQSMPPNGLLSSARDGSRAIVLRTFACVRPDPRATHVQPLDAYAPTLFPSAAVEDRHPIVGPWKARWQWPAWWSVPRVCLREGAQSLPERIRLPASMGPGRRALPDEPA